MRGESRKDWMARPLTGWETPHITKNARFNRPKSSYARITRKFGTKVRFAIRFRTSGEPAAIRGTRARPTARKAPKSMSTDLLSGRIQLP